MSFNFSGTGNEELYSQLFKAGNISGLIALFEKDLKKNIQDPNFTQENLIEQGPLNKSKDTYDLENIFLHIMSGNKITMSVLPNNEIMINMMTNEGSKDYNLTQTLKHANSSHLELSNVDMSMYEKYVRNNSIPQPRKPSGVGFPSEAYFRERDKAGELKNLSYAEMLAINIYTSDYYRQMNGLLRGNLVPKDTQELQDTLVHLVMASSGLNKVSDTNVNATFRGENIFGDGTIHRERIEHAKKLGGVTFEQGFLSTAVGKVPNAFNNMDVRIAYQNVKGKHIQAISVYPEEREFLMPPTQMSWNHHAEEKGKTYFIAKAVTTPQGLSIRTQESPKNVSEIRQNQNIQRANFILQQVANIKNDFDKQKKKIHTNPARRKQIAELMLKAGMLLENKDLPPDQKLREISQVMLNVNESIKHEKKPFFGLFSSKSRLSKSIEAIQSQIPTARAHMKASPTLKNPERVEEIVKLSNMAEELYEQYLSKPFTDTSYKADWEYNYKNGKVERPNHGLAHTVRCAAYVPIVVEAFKNHYQEGTFDPKYTTSEAMEKMQIALMFAVVGRKNDIGFTNDPKTYNKFRQACVEAFKKYLQDHPDTSAKFTKDELKTYERAVLNFGDPSEQGPVAKVMRACHKLDLQRCYQESEMERKIYPEFDRNFGQEVATQLFNYAENCIRETGDRILSNRSGSPPQSYDSNVFPKSSKDFNFLVTKISEVDPPELRQKPTLQV